MYYIHCIFIYKVSIVFITPLAKVSWSLPSVDSNSLTLLPQAAFGGVDIDNIANNHHHVTRAETDFHPSLPLPLL